MRAQGSHPSEKRKAFSGSHSFTGQRGLVIDVSKMKQIHLNKKKSTAIVGSGNTVGRIAKTLAPLGYIAPFGDSPTVGIGGITLGGGIGPLQRRPRQRQFDCARNGRRER
ncbi:FAD-binding protein [Paenibacillus sp. R14(2021)]|uniref:FAD-binding protein n=1 Tax=Paenibacillus sp. R14(2021) TaxID=2859228 RepID=UPI00280B599B|nr:FAD-binding protein [Paenibacillus sp. R14(2021)]